MSRVERVGSLTSRLLQQAFLDGLKQQRCQGRAFIPNASAINAASGSAGPAASARSKPGFLSDVYKLCKGKLSLIVVSTAAAGFTLGSSEVIDYGKLAATCAGTFACSAAANAFNQLYEIKNDGLMRRTMLRPLPSGRMTPGTALAFACITGVGGVAYLASQVHPLTAALGAGNIFLYVACYTPLKQLHPLNTWVGAIVGAVPPVMGWTAATGSFDPGALFLGSLLYFWQLPHFMALSWMCKADYIAGGYRMISRFDPTGMRTAGVALRNALCLIPLGIAAACSGLLTPLFAYESVFLSGLFALSASVFYARPSQQTARSMFKVSLLHLPLYMLLCAVHRIPNDGTMTWESAVRHLTTGSAAMEKRVLNLMPLASSTGRVCPQETMFFVFSPPMVLPQGWQDDHSVLHDLDAYVAMRRERLVDSVACEDEFDDIVEGDR